MMMKMTYKGFVVNVYDPLNYDIDIVLLDKEYKMKVIHNNYCYKNVLQDGTLSLEYSSCSYRCRLNGIEINNKHYSKHHVKQMMVEIKKLVDREDGWVNCIIYGVDIFNRLLVDIILPHLNIDLCQYILNKSAMLTNTLYLKYHPKKILNQVDS